jgi:hypothetical protein
MTVKGQSISLVGLLIGTTIFFISVNPGTLPVALILLPFILLFLILLLGSNLLISYFFTISNKSRRVIALAVSVLPVLLLVIQSITQLTLRDVILTMAILVVIVWYSLRLNSFN